MPGRGEKLCPPKREAGEAARRVLRLAAGCVRLTVPLCWLSSLACTNLSWFLGFLIFFFFFSGFDLDSSCCTESARKPELLLSSLTATSGFSILVYALKKKKKWGGD